MVLGKILKRKDASSVFVAVLLALIVQPVLMTMSHIAAMLSGLDDGQYASSAYPGTGWQGEYLYPVVLAILEIILLEVLVRLYIWFASSMKK